MRLSRTQSLFGGFGTLLLFFLLASLFISRTPKTFKSTLPAVQAVKTEGGAVSFELGQFHRSETKEGKKLWEISAARGQYFPETNTARIFDATLFLFKDQKTIELKAGEALVHLSGATLTKAEIFHGVTLTYDKGRLETDQAVYDREHETVTAPGYVKIFNPSSESTGYSLQGDLQTNQFFLEHDVHTIFHNRK